MDKLTKRAILLLVACTTTTVVQAQSRLAVTISGRPAGYATISQHLEKDGVKVVELRLELQIQGHSVKVDSQARYDPKGMPSRKFQETITADAGVHRQVVATFDNSGASLVILDGDKRSVKSVPLGASESRTNMSEFWFIRDIPKAGQVEETRQFNMDSLQWETVRTVFNGKKTLKIENHSVSVFEVVSKHGDQETTSYLDEHGLPILVDQGGVKMVKIWAK